MNSNSTGGIDNKTIIIVLLVLLSLSFLGINILTILGDLLKTIVSILGPLVSQILSIFGYTTGSILNKTADVVGDVAKTGVDIAEGSLQSVGTILKDASRAHVDSRATNSLDNVLNVSTSAQGQPAPTPGENPIQKPIASGKSGWFLSDVCSKIFISPDLTRSHTRALSVVTLRPHMPSVSRPSADIIACARPG